MQPPEKRLLILNNMIIHCFSQEVHKNIAIKTLRTSKPSTTALNVIHFRGGSDVIFKHNNIALLNLVSIHCRFGILSVDAEHPARK